MSGSDTRPLLHRWEWLFPLSGRWLHYFLVGLGCVAYLYGLRLAEMAPHLASATHVRAAIRPSLGMGERTGNWSQKGTELEQEYGPLKLTFAYPARGHRSPSEYPSSLALNLLMLLLPWLALAALVPRAQFWLYGKALIATGCVLLFPMVIACGPMGCSSICPWHFLWYGVLHQH